MSPVLWALTSVLDNNTDNILTRLWHYTESQWIAKVQSIHHVGTKNVFTKYCPNVLVISLQNKISVRGSKSLGLKNHVASCII